MALCIFTTEPSQSGCQAFWKFSTYATQMLPWLFDHTNQPRCCSLTEATEISPNIAAFLDECAIRPNYNTGVGRNDSGACSRSGVGEQHAPNAGRNMKYAKYEPRLNMRHSLCSDALIHLLRKLLEKDRQTPKEMKHAEVCYACRHHSRHICSCSCSGECTHATKGKTHAPRQGLLPHTIHGSRPAHVPGKRLSSRNALSPTRQLLRGSHPIRSNRLVQAPSSFTTILPSILRQSVKGTANSLV